MAKYDSILDAVHANVDALIEAEILTEDVKQANVAESLKAINTGLLEELGSETKEEIEENNATAETNIADQLGILLEIVTAYATAE